MIVWLPRSVDILPLLKLGDHWTPRALAAEVLLWADEQDGHDSQACALVAGHRSLVSCCDELAITSGSARQVSTLDTEKLYVFQKTSQVQDILKPHELVMVMWFSTC